MAYYLENRNFIANENFLTDFQWQLIFGFQSNNSYMIIETIKIDGNQTSSSTLSLRERLIC